LAAQRYSMNMKYVGRLTFLALYFLVGIYPDAKIQGVFLVGAFLYAIFWAMDQNSAYLRTRNMRRLLDAVEEKSSPLYWEEEYIRYDYWTIYNPVNKIITQLNFFEPWIWLFGMLVVLVMQADIAKVFHFSAK